MLFRAHEKEAAVLFLGDCLQNLNYQIIFCAVAAYKRQADSRYDLSTIPDCWVPIDIQNQTRLDCLSSVMDRNVVRAVRTNVAKCSTSTRNQRHFPATNRTVHDDPFLFH